MTGPMYADCAYPPYIYKCMRSEIFADEFVGLVEIALFEEGDFERVQQYLNAVSRFFSINTSERRNAAGALRGLRKNLIHSGALDIDTALEAWVREPSLEALRTLGHSIGCMVPSD